MSFCFRYLYGTKYLRNLKYAFKFMHWWVMIKTVATDNFFYILFAWLDTCSYMNNLLSTWALINILWRSHCLGMHVFFLFILIHVCLIFYNLQLIISDSVYIGYSTTNWKDVEKEERLKMHVAIFFRSPPVCTIPHSFFNTCFVNLLSL